MAKKRIFIIDDHPVCRHGMAQVINSETDLVVCGETGSAAQAASGLGRAHADLVLLDVSDRGLGGLELIRQLRADEPTLPILVVSGRDDSRHVLRMLRAGARGYVMKSEGLHDFIGAIRKVLGGQLYLHATFGEQLISSLARSEEPPAEAPPLDRLTPRELEVLRLIRRRLDSREIAEELHLSPKTVETHRLHIKEKLGFASMAELVRFAVERAEDLP
jgi:DNA-binding NarL/FixJ family response regulator